MTAYTALCLIRRENMSQDELVDAFDKSMNMAPARKAHQFFGQMRQILNFALVWGRMSPQHSFVRECCCHHACHTHVGQQHELLYQLVGLPLRCSTQLQMLMQQSQMMVAYQSQHDYVVEGCYCNVCCAHVGQQHDLLHQLVGLPLRCDTPMHRCS